MSNLDIQYLGADAVQLKTENPDVVRQIDRYFKRRAEHAAVRIYVYPRSFYDSKLSGCCHYLSTGRSTLTIKQRVPAPSPSNTSPTMKRPANFSLPTLDDKATKRMRRGGFQPRTRELVTVPLTFVLGGQSLATASRQAVRLPTRLPRSRLKSFGFPT